MKRSFALSIISIALAQSIAWAGDIASTGLCRRVDADRKGWTHPLGGAHANEIWVIRANCKSLDKPSKSYRPVSGGFRYEGIWTDTSIAQEWQVVANEPYQSLGNGPVDGWQCMVRSTGTGHTPIMPEIIWCSVTCCPH